MASHSTTTPFALLLALLLSCSAASAFNITRILDQSPDFGTFNSYLTQTELAAEINRRQTITVLAVDNSAISALSSQPLDVVRKVLSVHVVLDYYDNDKLRGLSKRSTLLTTLFQSTGLANHQMGFINITQTPNGIRLGSAVRGAALDVQLVKTVAARPYNISVLQVSGVIVPPGIEDADEAAVLLPPPSPATKKAQAPKPAAPAPAPAAPAPAASSPEADSPDAVSPPAPSGPAEAPKADAPSSVASPSDAPAADAPAADQVEAPSPSKSSGTKVVFGAGLAAVVGVAMLAAL